MRCRTPQALEPQILRAGDPRTAPPPLFCQGQARKREWRGLRETPPPRTLGRAPFATPPPSPFTPPPGGGNPWCLRPGPPGPPINPPPPLFSPPPPPP